MTRRGLAGLESTGLWALPEEVFSAGPRGLLDRVIRQAARAVSDGAPRGRRKALLGIEVWGATGAPDDLTGIVRIQGRGATGGGGNVAVVNVFGVLTQHPSWWTTSTEEVRDAIATALVLPEVQAIVLRLDTPGGSVQGMPQLADYVRSARAIKPILGHADSHATSCGFWLLASCEEAWASPLADVASIGVLVEHTSFAGMDKQLGIKRTLIRVPEGKALAWDGQDLTEEAQQQLLSRVRAAYNVFAGQVAKGRGVAIEQVRSEEWGRGRILDASAAAAAGMINGVRTFSETVAAAARMAKTRASTAARAADSTSGNADNGPDPDLLADLAQFGHGPEIA